jgi:hypothetical protein
VLAQITELKEVVANQEVSPEDVQRMLHERERLREAMAKVCVCVCVCVCGVSVCPCVCASIHHAALDTVH